MSEKKIFTHRHIVEELVRTVGDNKGIRKYITSLVQRVSREGIDNNILHPEDSENKSGRSRYDNEDILKIIDLIKARWEMPLQRASFLKKGITLEALDSIKKNLEFRLPN